MPFLEKFGPKCQNCQFKVKFDTEVNSNMHNPMMVFTFFFFCRKCFFGQIWYKMALLGKFGIKYQNGQFKVKIDT